MDKRPLIVVSLCAVVLLVLGSLSNVVGYQSVKSTLNDSPLFNVRTQKATNQQQNSITSQYLGMGKGNVLKVFIPSRNNERILLQKALNRLHGMDDATFTQFLKEVLSWLSIQDKYNEVNIPQLIISLRQIKENPKAFEQYVINYNNDLPADEAFTVDEWFPGCYLYNIITYILSWIIFILIFIFVPTITYTCRLTICNCLVLHT